MAITVYPDTPVSSVTPSDYLEFLDEYIDPRDIDAITETSSMLAALASDRSLCTRHLNQYLQDFLNQRKQKEFGVQSHLMGFKGVFILRFNIWLPTRQELSGVQRDLEHNTYSYEFAHDHNFDFMTIGYLGGGYRTSIYEYDGFNVDGVIGERVDLRHLEETSLPEGKVMLYRAMRDIHTQHTPDETSISINLLIDNPSYHLRPQFVFDVTSARIHALVSQCRLATKASLIPLAAEIADGNTKQLLVDIGRDATLPFYLRAVALESLQRLDEDSFLWVVSSLESGMFAKIKPHFTIFSLYHQGGHLGG